MATSKIRVTVPLSVQEVFDRLSNHSNLASVVDQVTTSKLIKKSPSSDDINGLGAIRQITFKGDLLTEKIVNWYPPDKASLNQFEKSPSFPKKEIGYDYKVIAGKRTIADHLGVIRISAVDGSSSHVAWDIHLKVPFWATGEIAAHYVCRAMEKEIAASLKKNLR